MLCSSMQEIIVDVPMHDVVEQGIKLCFDKNVRKGGGPRLGKYHVLGPRASTAKQHHPRSAALAAAHFVFSRSRLAHGRWTILYTWCNRQIDGTSRIDMGRAGQL